MIIFSKQKVFCWIGLSLLLITCCAAPAHAQAGQTLEITPPNTEQYPLISLYLDAYDPTGAPVEGLTAEGVELYENGEKLALDEFQAISPGIQLVFAFNVAPPLGIQDVLGNSRLFYIQEAITNWLKNTPEASSDDLSLLSNDGLEITHQDNPEAILSSLEAYQPLPRETTADLTVLSRAIELASDPVDQAGMKKVVLLFTPPPSPQDIGAVQNLITQAADQQVRIYPILVSSPAFFSSEGAGILQEMAIKTGGEYYAYAGKVEEEQEEEEENGEETPEEYENLPDINQLLDRFRHTYQLSYRSQIVTEGTHTLEIQSGTEINPVTVSREFFLEVKPPNPVLLGPPREVIRTNTNPEEPDTPIQEYQPDSLALQALVEFPDGHPRKLEETILRINGEITERRTSEPFDQFTWDLSQITSTGTYYLTVEAVDELGLSRMSFRTPVKVVIETPNPTVRTVFNENRVGFFTLAVILALGLGLLIMIVQGIIQPKGFPGNNRFFSKSTQQQPGGPAEGAGRDTETVRWSPGFEPATRESEQTGSSTNRLISINEAARQNHPQPIFLQKETLKVGSQTAVADLTIHHRSISDRHAQLTWDSEEQTYQILDLNSASGTWINYDQLEPEEKHLLKNGDIIHFGQAGFRYQQAEKPS